MPSNLMNIVQKYFFQVLHHGSFECTKCFWDSKHFGNEIIEYEGSHFRIRFVSDRGYVYVDVCKSGYDEWEALGDVLAILGLAGDYETADESRRLQALAKDLLENYPRVVTALSDENYATTLEHLRAYQERRVRKMFPQLFGE